MSRRDAVGTPLIQVLEADLVRNLVAPTTLDPIKQKSVSLSEFRTNGQGLGDMRDLNAERMHQVFHTLKRKHLPVITSHSSQRGYELHFGRYIIAHHYENKLNGKVSVVSFDLDWQPGDASQNKKLLFNTLTNLVKENVLSTLEQAKAFQFLNTYFGLNQSQISNACGCSRSQVSNIQRLLSLPESLLNDLESGKISSSHCRTLLALKDNPNALSYYASLVKEQNISVHALNDLIRVHHSSNLLESTISQLRTEGLELTLEQARNGGRVVIAFKDSNELHRILERLKD
jgi:ParB family chromosome partitioning protein